MQVLEVENALEEPQILLWESANSQSTLVLEQGKQESITIQNEKTTKTASIALESRRYIGNKNKLLTWIFDTIAQHTQDCEVFFDVFAGTGTVGKQAMKSYKKVILNDILYANEIIYKAFFLSAHWNQNKVENILESYNNLSALDLKENYFSENFGGKFFDYENAKIIGHIREDIEHQKTDLTEKEYSILLATLIYNIDKIANTVGHFDAYIKKPIRSQKLHLRLIEIIDFQDIEIYRTNANELARKIKTDIAYIDPPYNSRQYSRFYHVYENLVKWQKPELSGVALKPPTENSSAYCTTQAPKAFADLIENLEARYIVVSYNNTYNSKSSSSENKIKLEEIEAILKNKGETQVFECSHKFFNTGKTEFNNHKEYLFITKTKKQEKKLLFLRSPLFYVGDKFKLIPQIKKYFPTQINQFIEPFMGGGSVFLNVEAEKYVLNDLDKNVITLHQFLQENAKDKVSFFKKIDDIIDSYGLSKSYREDIVPAELKQKFVKSYYAKFNKNAFQQLKNNFNKDQNQTILLYLLLIYGFNRMIRFNSKGAYNLPVGNVDFNKNVVGALQEYFTWMDGKKIHFFNTDYKIFLEKITITAQDFVYLDPPYLITFSEYNKLWNEEKEQELTQFLDVLNSKNIRFAISNVTHYKGKENTIFLQWSQKYNIYPIKSNYISYHDNTIKNFQEVLVTNYEKTR